MVRWSTCEKQDLRPSLRSRFLLVGAAVMAGLVAVGSSAAEVNPTFLHKLSNFTGPIPFSWSKIFIDQGQEEAYVMSGDAISVFNGNGMEIYRLDYDRGLGVVYDAVVDQDGNVLLLTYQGLGYRLSLCSYRMEPLATIHIQGIPEDFGSFSPNRLVYHQGSLHLASLSQMKVAVVDKDGTFVRGYDLAAMLGLEEQKRADTGLGGFCIDPRGNFLFTIPVNALAYRLSPDGTLESFGKRGSAPGKFGVISGIAADASGNILVADKLRCVVMVFDENFRFLTEFGGRGPGPGHLTAPSEMAMDKGGKVYVSQLGRKGVNVYQVTR